LAVGNFNDPKPFREFLIVELFLLSFGVYFYAGWEELFSILKRFGEAAWIKPADVLKEPTGLFVSAYYAVVALVDGNVA
jgi:hypothetical protein